VLALSSYVASVGEAAVQASARGDLPRAGALLLDIKTKLNSELDDVVLSPSDLDQPTS
jgi:hypothetical protein